MLLLAVVSYRYVEQPLRCAQWSAVSLQSIGYGMGLSFIGSAIVLATSKLSPTLYLDTIFPSKLSLTLKGKNNWGKEPDKGCHLSYGVVYKFQIVKCLAKSSVTFAAKGGRIFFIGDSHADHYVESLQTQMLEQSIRSFTIGWGCGYIHKEDIKEKRLNEKNNCSLYNQLVNDFIEHDVNAGDIVILGHRWVEKKNHSYRKESLYQLALKLTERNASLVLIDDVAELGVDNPLLCEQRWWRPFLPKTCYKSLASVVAEQSSQDEMHQEIARKTKNTYSISLRTLYCSKDDFCGPYIEGTSVYRDGSHLRREASVIGSKKLKVLLNSILTQSR
jgi:SGNH domain (fused to AT3 domains)